MTKINLLQKAVIAMWIRLCVLAAVFIGALGFASGAHAYDRIQNRWKPEQHLHIEYGKIEAGAIKPEWWSAQWTIEQVPGTPYVRFKNRWKPDQYLHIERLLDPRSRRFKIGSLISGPVDPTFFQAMWMLEPAEAGFHRIRNRLSETYIHIEYGALAHGTIQPAWWSAQWRIFSRDDVASRYCRYPQSHALDVPIERALAATKERARQCSSFHLDTREEHKRTHGHPNAGGEGPDHHQGIERTQRLNDGSAYYFLTHSEMDDDDQGQLMQFRYAGPMHDGHIVQTNPLNVAAMIGNPTYLKERHPSDMEFLRDVNDSESGYLFVVEGELRRLAVYRWKPGKNLERIGVLAPEFPTDSYADFVILDLIDDSYYLALWNSNTDVAWLYIAKAYELFPACNPGQIALNAFMPRPVKGLPRTKASQMKLVRDSTSRWYLLGYRSDPPSEESAIDYVDVYSADLRKFEFAPQPPPKHISLPRGDTGFASNGTHYVEPSGKLLLSSSYRWAKNEGGAHAYVSRVDECRSR